MRESSLTKDQLAAIERVHDILNQLAREQEPRQPAMRKEGK